MFQSALLPPLNKSLSTPIVPQEKSLMSVIDAEKSINDVQRPHPAGPFYKPYIANNKDRVWHEMEHEGFNDESLTQKKKREDWEYRNKLALELKLYEEAQCKTKQEMQNSLKKNLADQIKFKELQKENAFRMTKREKVLNQKDLHNWKESKPDIESCMIPGWGYNSRYKYLYQNNNNGFKRNMNSSEFPLGGDNHKNVQNHAHNTLKKLENNIRDTSDNVFNLLANHRVEDAESRMNKLAPRTYSPTHGNNNTMEYQKRGNPLYQSEPNLL